VLDRLIAMHPKAVIAAGGGIVAEAASFSRLLETCLTVWVKAAPEEHMQRVIDQGDLRPMRDNRRSMADLRAILASREALYARADIQLETTGRDVAATLAALVAAVAG
jgi:XRE family transcriptional regulator, aerobic/anaerobic benzoate catabolism transcriptional regulator